MKKALRDAIRSYQGEITDFTRELVAIPTENPPGRSYRQCVEVITRKLRQMGLGYEVLEVPRPGLHPRFCVLSLYGAGRRTLYFHGHYDVVPAQKKTQFQPRVRNGGLHGRGSADMKSGLAAMIYAVRAVKECGIKLRGRLGLTIVPDEETGGARGSGHLASTDLLGKHGIGMLTAEPTGGVIWNASRGAISLRINVKGKAAHVGLQHQGINAFERMLAVAKALLRLKTEVESRTTRFKIHPKAARRSILMIGGELEGGANFNVVPAMCSFTVDRRINPEENLAAEKRRLLELFQRLKRQGIDLDVEILQEGRSSGVLEDHPLAQTLARSVGEITGQSAKFEMCPGLLESRFYAERGIPAFAYGPGLLSVAHGPNEFVRLKDVCQCAAIYALTAARVLGEQQARGYGTWNVKLGT